jgi:hypothetical protein
LGIALAAAATCASSRCLSAAKHPDTSRHHAQSQSGSTRHDKPQSSPESGARANRLIAGSRVSASPARQTPPSHLLRRTTNRKCAFTRCSNPDSKQSTLSPHHRTRLHTLSPLQPNPHSAAPLIVPNLPRVPSLAALGRRPRCQPPRPQWGRRPKPFTIRDSCTAANSTVIRFDHLVGIGKHAFWLCPKHANHDLIKPSAQYALGPRGCATGARRVSPN